jgi:hypothetical protein
MAQRGRKSAASLSIVSVLGNKRPAPPEELTEEEAEEWRAIAGRMPPDWFTRESHPLLAAYCRHIVAARLLAKDIERFSRFPPEVRLASDGIELYDRLRKMADRESRVITTLATKMRLSQQSRYTENRAATAANRSKTVSKPWEVDPYLGRPDGN